MRKIKFNFKDYIKDFNENFNGDKSILYKYIKEELKKMNYECYSLPFREEFLFFEKDYINIIMDMKKRKFENKKIIDIGCQLGIQSILFQNQRAYIGIDRDISENEFFGNLFENSTLIKGTYPIVKINYENSIVISNMSLGYFNILNKTEEETLDLIIEELKNVKYLYIRTSIKLRDKLSNYFHMEHLEEEEKEYNKKVNLNDINIFNNLYFMKNKKSIPDMNIMWNYGFISEDVYYLFEFIKKGIDKKSIKYKIHSIKNILNKLKKEIEKKDFLKINLENISINEYKEKLDNQIENLYKNTKSNDIENVYLNLSIIYNIINKIEKDLNL